MFHYILYSYAAYKTYEYAEFMLSIGRGARTVWNWIAPVDKDEGYSC